MSDAEHPTLENVVTAGNGLVQPVTKKAKRSPAEEVVAREFRHASTHEGCFSMYTQPTIDSDGLSWPSQGARLRIEETSEEAKSNVKHALLRR